LYTAPYFINQVTFNPELQKVIDGVKEAVQGEREDELFYDYLISVAPTREEKGLIESIRDDERRHNRLFRRIYKDFTGMEVPAGQEEAFEKPKSYLDGIKRALFGELSAVERYREIRKDLPEGLYRDILFDIITDELKHGAKYNYLYTINSSNTTAAAESANQSKANFTPDDWVRYITPLVNRALAEAKEGINPEHLYQEFILSGVLVGLGKSPQEAIEQVEEWEKTGVSQLLAKSKMNRGFYY
jgi:rubrerythrin